MASLESFHSRGLPQTFRYPIFLTSATTSQEELKEAREHLHLQGNQIQELSQDVQQIKTDVQKLTITVQDLAIMVQQIAATVQQLMKPESADIKAEITAIEKQQEILNVVDEHPSPSAINIASLEPDDLTVIPDIQESSYETSPKDDISPKVQLTSLPEPDAVVQTTSVLEPDTVVQTTSVTPPSPGSKWNNMSPRIREPPKSENNQNVYALHGLSGIHVHKPRGSRRITRGSNNTGAYKDNNTGAYKDTQITPVHIEPPSQLGLKTQLADPVLSQDDGDPIIGGGLIRARTGD